MAQAKMMTLIERHVEKAVVGICALLFLYGLFHWGFSSPRTLDRKPLHKVDADLKADASTALGRSNTAPRVPNAIPPYEEAMRKLENADYARLWGPLVELGVASAGATDTGRRATKKPTLADLQPPPAPPAPTVQAVMELPNDGQELHDQFAGHGALLYPRGKLEEFWKSKLMDRSASRAAPIALSVEVQVRERLPGGAWSEPRPVKAVLGPGKPEDLALLAKSIPGIRSAETGNRDATAIQAAVGDLRKEESQALVRCPPYWGVWDSTARAWGDWKGEPIKALLPQIAPPGPAMAPPGGMPSPAEPGTLAVVPTPPLPAVSEPGAAPPPAEPRTGADMPVWFHDVGLQPRTTYEYRVRLEFVNPLLAYVDETDPGHPEDAWVPSVWTPWSDWSGGAEVERPTAFFLAGDIRGKNQVRVSVFTVFLGMPVKDDFYVQPGEPIGSLKAVKVPDPLGAGPAQTRKVDFRTGAIATMFDFNRSIVRDDLRRTTVEMLYLDLQGRLQTRILAEDEDSKEFKNWQRRIRKAAAPAAPVPAPESAEKAPHG